MSPKTGSCTTYMVSNNENGSAQTRFAAHFHGVSSVQSPCTPRCSPPSLCALPRDLRALSRIRWAALLAVSVQSLRNLRTIFALWKRKRVRTRARAYASAHSHAPCTHRDNDADIAAEPHRHSIDFTTVCMRSKCHLTHIKRRALSMRGREERVAEEM